MSSDSEKSKARYDAAAKKIHAAMLAIEPSAVLEDRFGLPAIAVGEFVFLVREAHGKRAGTWSIREPSLNESETLYCPNTHATLEPREARNLPYLLRKCRETAERRKVQEERSSTLADISSALPVSASVEPARDYYGGVGDVLRFGVKVPLDRGAEFADLVRRFFEVEPTS